MELKYVRHERVGFILWPRTNELWHSHVGILLGLTVNGKIVSAGFATISGERPVCFGESESLGIASRDDDSEALAKQLGLIGTNV